MKILMTGVTGLIGRELSRSLTGEGHAVTGLSRSPERASGVAVAEMLKWEPQSGPPPAEGLEGADVVVHLAGEPIAARRWTDEQKRRIRDSRVLSTRNLVEGMASATERPKVFICGSAVGYYGNRGDERVDEASAPGNDFMSQVCQEWEGEAARARALSIRVVEVRTGVVLSDEDGALKKMLPAFKLGVAGPLGGGNQWFPWIHLADIVGIFRHAINLNSLDGPINGTAPNPVTNAEFTKELGRVLHRPTILPVPEFGLRLLMGEMADVVLTSERVLPRVAEATGYEFHFPDLASALEDLLSEKRSSGRAATGTPR